MLFVPIAGASIYMVTRSDVSWQRSVVIVNKEKLEVIYLIEETRAGKGEGAGGSEA